MVSKELVAASSAPLLLAILARGDSYGYEIIQSVRELSGGQLEWTEGMLYPVLHRLEREGLIQSYWQTAANGRKRRYYRTKPAARKRLLAERQQWLAVHQTLLQLWGATSCLT